MSTTVAGDATNFPDDLTIPSDGDGPGIKAADVNVAFEGLADRTAYLKAHLDDLERAVNIISANAPGGTMNWGFFNARWAQWWVIGDSTDARFSNDMGHEWTAAVLEGDGEDLLCGDDDIDGEMVVSTNSRYVFATDGSGEWSKNDALLADVTVLSSAVVYDVDNASWCLVTSDGGTDIRFKISTDRETWTAADTAPTLAAAGNVRLAANATGRIVFAQLVAAGVNISHSDDGGDTWTSPTTISVSSLTELSLTYNSFTDEFLLTYGQTGPCSSVLKKSSDGITFTTVATMAETCFRQAVPLRKYMLVATAYEEIDASAFPLLAYSIDDGATWKRAGTQFGGSTLGRAFAGGGGVLALTAEKAYVTARVGEPDLGSLA